MNMSPPTHPITLSLELSQQIGSVALSNRRGKIEEIKIGTNCREEDEVMPAIKKLALDLDIAPKSVDLIVVSIGPGGFTGLRSAVAITKMISLVSEAATVPIETAISVAHHANKGGGPFFIVSGVKQESFWLSKVQFKNERWACESDVSTTVEMEKNLSGMAGVFGDSYLPESVQALCSSNNISIYNSITTASSLLSLGTRLYAEDNNVAVNPLELTPLYPREPEAVRVWKTKRPTG